MSGRVIRGMNLGRLGVSSARTICGLTGTVAKYGCARQWQLPVSSTWMGSRFSTMASQRATVDSNSDYRPSSSNSSFNPSSSSSSPSSSPSSSASASATTTSSANCVTPPRPKSDRYNWLHDLQAPSTQHPNTAFMTSLPKSVRIVEVGPRDGLQNEKEPISTASKIRLIDQLSECGIPTIESASFVSPKWVPQMADAKEVMAGIHRKSDVSYTVLTPNLQGFKAALASNATEVAIFAAASESFSQANINCSIDESISRFEPVLQEARKNGVRVRGYISCVLGCPFEGPIAPEAVAKVAERLYKAGCYEISLGDTIGIGTAGSTIAMLQTVSKVVPKEILAVHFHDTYGQALANILIALQFGIRTIDSSIGGLGGCPYAKGATGNVATEDVVYMLHGLGIETGIHLPSLLRVSSWITTEIGVDGSSRAATALIRNSLGLSPDELDEHSDEWTGDPSAFFEDPYL